MAEKQFQTIFRNVDSDPAVKGLGATTTPGERPVDIVPKEQFANMTGYNKEIIESEKITVTKRETLTIVSPVLKYGKNKWKFEVGGKEYYINIADQNFLSNILNGRIHTPMRAGVQMEGDITEFQERENGSWKTKKRSVDRISNLRSPPPEPLVPFPE